MLNANGDPANTTQAEQAISAIRTRKLTAVFAAVLLDGHLFGELGERLIDRLAAAQAERQASLKPLHLLHGPVRQGGPAGRTHTHSVNVRQLSNTCG